MFNILVGRVCEAEKDYFVKSLEKILGCCLSVMLRIIFKSLEVFVHTCILLYFLLEKLTKECHIFSQTL